MVDFKLGFEIKKDELSTYHQHGKQKKCPSADEELNLKPLDGALRRYITSFQAKKG